MKVNFPTVRRSEDLFVAVSRDLFAEAVHPLPLALRELRGEEYICVHKRTLQHLRRNTR